MRRVFAAGAALALAAGILWSAGSSGPSAGPRSVVRAVPHTPVVSGSVRAMTVLTSYRDGLGGAMVPTIYGPHVTNFQASHPGTWIITLDREYEYNEVAIIVTPGPLDNFPTYSNTRFWSDTMAFAPTAWSTGITGDKDQRIITNNAIVMQAGLAAFDSASLQSDPVTILLFFLTP